MKRGFKANCERRSLDLRAKLGLSSKDPIDPIEIAKELNIIVISAKDMVNYGMTIDEISNFSGHDKYNFSAVTLTTLNGKIIIYNPFHSERRTKSNLTHELAHQICGHDFSKLSQTENGCLMREFPNSDEKEADWLTGVLLIPREGLVWSARKGMNVEDISEHFETTIEIARWRYYKSGVSKQMRYINKYR